MLTRGALCVLHLAQAAAAAAAPLYYDDAVLAAEVDRRRADVVYAVESDVIPYLPADSRDALSGLEIETPLHGRSNAARPMDFYSEPAARRIYLPIESMKFVSELSALMAWQEEYGCSDLFPHYLHNLASYGPPFSAFAIDAKIASNTVADDVWTKLAVGALYFMIAHELGHVALGHRYSPDPVVSIPAEGEADSFALDYFASRRLNPAGVYFYFLAASSMDPVVPVTHPLSPERIRAVSRAMSARPDAFVAPESSDPVGDRAGVLSIARQLDGIASALVTSRQAMDARGLAFPLVDLRTACAAGR